MTKSDAYMLFTISLNRDKSPRHTEGYIENFKSLLRIYRIFQLA